MGDPSVVGWWPSQMIRAGDRGSARLPRCGPHCSPNVNFPVPCFSRRTHMSLVHAGFRPSVAPPPPPTHPHTHHHLHIRPGSFPEIIVYYWRRRAWPSVGLRGTTVTHAFDREGSQYVFISQKVFLKSFCKSQFPHKSVHLFFISVIVEDKLTNL